MRPTPEQLALLTRAERLTFRFCDWVNSTPWVKRVSHWAMRYLGSGWVHPFTKNLVITEGLDELAIYQPPKGTLVVSNHRSFFDMYVISSVLFRNTKLLGRIHYPVRSDFFYEGPLGLFVNGVMSGFSMYPPVLRQPERSEFNKYAMARVAEILQVPGNAIGFHPEGTRNKTDDPYTLLPAQPGVGQLILQAKPTVVPVFIHGLGNNLPRQVWSNFDGTGRKIIIIFGKPIDLERFYTMSPRLRTYMDIARHVRDVITELGARERVLRAQLEKGPPPSPSGDERAVA